jgi:hypothetical protein
VGVGVGSGVGVGVGVGAGVGVGVGVGVTPTVSVRVGEVTEPAGPWQFAPFRALTVNGWLPMGVAPVVVTDRVVDTFAVVMVSGFAPKTAAAPAGSPLALRVRVHALSFPFFSIDRFPKTAVAPGATDTLVGAATETAPGWAAMTVPIPASIATRAAEATVAASRRTTSGEGLRDDIRNRPRWRRSIAGVTRRW